MKNIFTLLVFFAIAISVKAQYYKQSRKNKAVLISNSFSLDKLQTLNSSVEFGTRKTRFLIHGGILASSNLYNKETIEYARKNYFTKPVLNAIGGLEINVLSFQLLNLSQKSYCKYLYGFLFLGVDGFKHIETPLNKDYGYRVKSYLSFCIYRSGSHKKDIGYVRHLQFGYCYTKPNLNTQNNKGYHGFILNFLIIKNKIIKFADWY
jgi:hypothetical protein